MRGEAASGFRGRLRAKVASLFLGALLLTLTPAALAVECEGDECQGPPPAPVETIPGTAVVEGPQNPPVRFPRARQPRKPHHKKPGAKENGKASPQRRGAG